MNNTIVNMNTDDVIINKIIDIDQKYYVIFFTYGCHYSEEALELLRNNKLPYKGYDINTIKGGLARILEAFSNNEKILAFDTTHRTKPIIFLNGKFLGGMTELNDHINKSK